MNTRITLADQIAVISLGIVISTESCLEDIIRGSDIFPSQFNV